MATTKDIPQRTRRTQKIGTGGQIMGTGYFAKIHSQVIIDDLHVISVGWPEPLLILRLA
jgi:hypothetical protein